MRKAGDCPGFLQKCSVDNIRKRFTNFITWAFLQFHSLQALLNTELLNLIVENLNMVHHALTANRIIGCRGKIAWDRSDVALGWASSHCINHP